MHYSRLVFGVLFKPTRAHVGPRDAFFVTTFRSHGLTNELSHQQHKVLKTLSNVAKQLWITISFENNASVAIETFSRGRRTSAPVVVKR